MVVGDSDFILRTILVVTDGRTRNAGEADDDSARGGVGIGGEAFDNTFTQSWASKAYTHSGWPYQGAAGIATTDPTAMERTLPAGLNGATPRPPPSPLYESWHILVVAVASHRSRSWLRGDGTSSPCPCPCRGCVLGLSLVATAHPLPAPQEKKNTRRE